jgi:DNA-binding LytR/AlgR family response regulator
MAQTCIIVDADINQSKKTKDILEKLLPSSTLLTFSKLHEAEKHVGSRDLRARINIFILFIDITSIDTYNLNISNKLRNKCAHIVATADSDQSAEQLFRLNIDDFIVSPINQQRLKQTIHQLAARNASINRSVQPGDFFFIDDVETGHKVKCNLNDIIVIESDDHLIKITTIGHTYRAHHTITDLDDALKASRMFVRVHRSFIVSLHYIDYISKGFIAMNGLPALIQIGKKYQDRVGRLIADKHLRSRLKTEVSSL